MSTTTRLSLREACGPISHDEASEMLTRFIASHFNGRMGSSGEHARITIPADPRRDDDLRLSAYIEQQRASTASLERELAELREAARGRLKALIQDWRKAAKKREQMYLEAPNREHDHGYSRALESTANALEDALSTLLPAASEPAKEPSDG